MELAWPQDSPTTSTLSTLTLFMEAPRGGAAPSPLQLSAAAALRSRCPNRYPIEPVLVPMSEAWVTYLPMSLLCVM